MDGRETCHLYSITYIIIQKQNVKSKNYFFHFFYFQQITPIITAFFPYTFSKNLKLSANLRNEFTNDKKIS